MTERQTPLWLRRTVLAGLLLVGFVVMRPFLAYLSWPLHLPDDSGHGLSWPDHQQHVQQREFGAGPYR
ncbi:MAG: hypothetical protein ABIX00_09120 [Polaromonas sp.]